MAARRVERGRIPATIGPAEGLVRPAFEDHVMGAVDQAVEGALLSDNELR